MSAVLLWSMLALHHVNIVSSRPLKDQEGMLLVVEETMEEEQAL